MTHRLPELNDAVLTAPCTLAVATVCAHTPPWYVLDCGALARRAESCLLEPAPGDAVLLCRTGSTHPATGPRAYLIAVLTRSSDDARLLFPGGASARCGPTGLALQAPKLHLRASLAAAVTAPVMVLEGRGLRLRFGRIGLLAANLRAGFGRVRTAAAHVLTVVGRAVHHADDCVRRIRGTDHTRAGRLHLQVQTGLHMQAGDAELLAQRRIHLDAKGIDLG